MVLNDTIYAATTEGIVVQNVRKPNYNRPINIYITSAQTQDSILYDVPSLVLNKNQNTLQINYTGISYNSGNDLYYKYILK